MSEDDLRKVQTTTDKEELKRLVLHLFHQLWADSKEGQAYDKVRWMALQTALIKLGVNV